MVGVVRDGARNMRAFCGRMGVSSFQCCAHLLHLVVTAALKEPSLDELITKIRKSVAFVHRSQPAWEAMKAEMAILNLAVRRVPMDVITRWNSTYSMMSEFYVQREAFARLQERMKKLDLPDRSEYATLGQILDVLELFDKETKRVNTRFHYY